MSTSPASSISGHILGVPAPAWGHQKPMVALACKFVQERPDIIVTILVLGPHGIVERMQSEIGKHISEESLKSNIRVINMEEKDAPPTDLVAAMDGKFFQFIKKLFHREPTPCTTGKLYGSAPKPSVAIIDFFLPGCAQAVNDIYGNDASILAWNTANAAFSLRVLGPERLGGFGDVAKQAAEVAAATGRSITEVETELYRPNKGEVIAIPGLPLMFDYEFTSHDGAMATLQAALFLKSYKFMQICHGMISASSIAYEKESLMAWRNWHAETNRRFYVIGPFLPLPVGHDALTQNTKSSNDLEIISFLDKTLVERGRNSVLYVSFGSNWWPNTEHVLMLIDILLELKFPFIMSHASPQAAIPPEVLLKVQASGIGLLSPWTPQQLILEHPATGWFLTHCGQNSVMEALGQGIPLIAWPLDADQPSNAARLSHLDLAFELFETRRGFGLKPLHRGVEPTGTNEAIQEEIRKVLEDARGRVGERKRQNAHRLRDEIQESWNEPNGGVLKQMRQLLTDYFP